MIELGSLVLLEPGESVTDKDSLVLSEEDLSLIRSLLAVVAMSSESSDLAQRLEDYFDADLTDEELYRFTIGPDGCGEPAVIPSKGA